MHAKHLRTCGHTTWVLIVFSLKCRYFCAHVRQLHVCSERQEHQSWVFLLSLLLHGRCHVAYSVPFLVLCLSSTQCGALTEHMARLTQESCFSISDSVAIMHVMSIKKICFVYQSLTLSCLELKNTFLTTVILRSKRVIPINACSLLLATYRETLLK